MKVKYRSDEVISEDGRLLPAGAGLSHVRADMESESSFAGEAGTELVVVRQIVEERRADILDWAERVRAAWGRDGAGRDDLPRVIDMAQRIARAAAECFSEDEASKIAEFLERQHSPAFTKVRVVDQGTLGYYDLPRNDCVGHISRKTGRPYVR